MAVENNTGHHHQAAPGGSFGGTGNGNASHEQTSTDFSAGGFQAAPSSHSMNVLGITSLFGRTTVSPQIKEYLKVIDENLQTQAAESPGVTFTRVELSDPQAAQAVIATDDASGASYAALIIFSDALPPSVDFTPSSMYVIPALQALRNKLGASKQFSLVASYVVMNEDLQRTNEMTSSLLMSLLPYVRRDLVDVTSANLSVPGVEYLIDPSVESAKAFEASMSPHTVRPRADFGFTVSLRLPRDRNMQVGNQPLSADIRPFMAVGAYVDMIGPFVDQSGQDRYQPLIRVTFIESTVPTFGAIALALPLMIEYFIRRGMWKRQFSKFADHTPNLGQLIPDQANRDKLWFAPDQRAMEAFIPIYTLAPVLCLDVVEGRQRISDLFMFQDSDFHGRIVDECVKFFGGAVPRFNGAVCKVANVDYIGAYGTRGGQLSDTRNVTYLDEVAKSGALDSETRRTLLNYFQKPIDRAATVARLCNGMIPLYQCSTVMISGQFISWISACVSNTNIRIVDPNGYSSTLAFNSMDPSFTNYSTFTSPVLQPGQFTGAMGLYSNMAPRF